MKIRIQRSAWGTALAALLFAISPAAQGKTYALLVGVGSYEDPKINDLGCLEADIALMRSTLVEALGPGGVEIAVLTNRQATAPGVERAFKTHLLQKAGPADTLLFYFSGHGSQVTDMDADEEDGKDEILVPFGASWANPASYILDDQLHQWLGEARSGQTVVILDSCHSGTGTRSKLGAFEKRCDLGFDGVTKAPFAFRPRQRNGFQSLKPGGSPNKVLVAACEANETALGLSTGSLLTAELCKEIRANAASPLGDIVARASARVVLEANARQHKQTPQIEGVKGVSLVTPPASASTRPRPASGAPAAAARGLGIQAPQASPPAPARPPQASAVLGGPPQLPATPENFEVFPVHMDIVNLADGTSVIGHDVKPGARLQIRVTSTKDGYLRLYHFDALQNSMMIFPNEYQPASRVSAHTPVVIPASAESFNFVVTADPTGVESIMAVCSTVPFSDAVGARIKDSPFFGIDPLKPSQAATRGIAVVSQAGEPTSTPSAAAKQTEIGHVTRSYKVVGLQP